MAWIHKASPDPGKSEAHPRSVMFDDRTLNDGSFRVLSIVGVGDDAYPGSPKTKLCPVVEGNSLHKSSEIPFFVWSWTSRA